MLRNILSASARTRATFTRTNNTNFCRATVRSIGSSVTATYSSTTTTTTPCGTTIRSMNNADARVPALSSHRILNPLLQSKRTFASESDKDQNKQQPAPATIDIAELTKKYEKEAKQKRALSMKKEKEQPRKEQEDGDGMQSHRPIWDWFTVTRIFIMLGMSLIGLYMWALWRRENETLAISARHIPSPFIYMWDRGIYMEDVFGRGASFFEGEDRLQVQPYQGQQYQQQQQLRRLK